MGDLNQSTDSQMLKTKPSKEGPSIFAIGGQNPNFISFINIKAANLSTNLSIS